MQKSQILQGESWLRWTHEIRACEFERMMEHVPLSRDATVLELGCGDGFQLELFRRRFARVFAIDPHCCPSKSEGFVFSLAEALPFPDHYFDLVSSCCVVEHLHDRARAVQEAVRVLRPGGYMAHAVPAPFWKAASLLLNPVGYPLRVMEKWWAVQQTRRAAPGPGDSDCGQSPPPGILQVLYRWFYPPVHGTYASHLDEFKAYTRRRWLEVFAHPELKRIAVIPLLSYSQFGFLRFRFHGSRSWMARHGCASSYAFLLRKAQ